VTAVNDDLVSHVVSNADMASMGLHRTFSPAQAALILRDLGLTEMTECALRTRAYRRQVPFHLNGHRIRFTASDLREIAEGEAQHPAARSGPVRPSASQREPRQRASKPSEPAQHAWRARGRSTNTAVSEAS
jgi:hypothetical protein